MDYYEILGVEPSASFEEIKRAYQDLARKFHPDKSGCEEKFHQIDKAYKVLRDSNERKIYDSERMQNQEHLIIHETVSRREFNHDTANNVYTHRCKCGSDYLLELSEYENNEEIILSCDECSLNILVT
jgi:curved DNA-binding protein CbpA